MGTEIKAEWSQLWKMVEKYNNAGFLGIERKLWEKTQKDFDIKRGYIDYLLFSKIHIDDIAYAIIKDDN